MSDSARFPAVPSPEARGVETNWTATEKAGFRFLFSFFTLILFTHVFVIQADMEAEFGFIPGAALIGKLYASLWAPMVAWTGHHVLGVHKALTYEAGGNSDGIFGHVQMFFVFALSLLAAVVWAALDRKSASYARLLHWLRVGLRYGLGFRMLGYGIAKLVHVQFTFPGLAMLRVPYGDFRPMTVLWNFMGYSSTYTFFAGAVELVGALLLFFRRTTLLGALITGGALANVLVLDIAYDVPEKLDVLWMLAVVGFLICPDVRRLGDALVLNRPAPPANLGNQYVGPRLARAALVIKALVVAYALLPWLIMAPKFRAENEARAPLYGIYRVREFSRNGQALPPLTTDTNRWAEVIFLSPSDTRIKTMDDSWRRYETESAPDGTKVSLFTEAPAGTNSFRCSRAGQGHLALEGTWAGDALTVQLDRLDEMKLPLVASRRRWINGFP